MQVPNPWNGILFTGPWPGVGRIPLYGSPYRTSTPGPHGQVNAPTQTRLSAEIVMNFAFEIWRELNPRGNKPPSYTVCDLNHSTNRVYTIGTECSHHMSVWNVGLLPRGFDSLHISNAKFIIQNSSQFQPRGEFAWEHLPVHVVQESVGFRCTDHHSRLQLLDYLMNFALEIWRESNACGTKPPSHTVCDLNHSTNRVFTIGTECSHHMWWEHLVPIVYTRLFEWSRSQTVWDGGFLPRGFDSLHISNAKFIIDWHLCGYFKTDGIQEYLQRLKLLIPIQNMPVTFHEFEWTSPSNRPVNVDVAKKSQVNGDLIYKLPVTRP